MRGSAILAHAGAVGFLVNMVLHTSAIGPVGRMAGAASKQLAALVPLLWLLFSLVLLLFGLIVMVHARPATPQRRPVLICAGIFPLATAVGQLVAFGWIFPELTLALTGILTLWAATTSPVPREQ